MVVIVVVVVFVAVVVVVVDLLWLISLLFVWAVYQPDFFVILSFGSRLSEIVMDIQPANVIASCQYIAEAVE